MELKLGFIRRISNGQDERIVDQGLIGDSSWKHILQCYGGFCIDLIQCKEGAV